MNQRDFCQKIQHYIHHNIPFFFLVDFDKKEPCVCPLNECKKENIKLDFHSERKVYKDINVKAFPVNKADYKKAFDKVSYGLHHGDSFLTNLTFPSPIETAANLDDIYDCSNALYKLKFKDEFVVFSPESFIRIKNNEISTFPMKGTIMANIPDAENQLLNDKKELREHNTIVDLMRNDLSMVAQNVEVKRFRYISEIMTFRGKMLQTSSEITGDLNTGWQTNFGELLLSMLPAGSISGAPKDKTVAIIKEAEIDNRGYYTGVFGIYNNGEVDSAVAIRYVEKTENGLQYRSGGGITFMSNADEEYDELLKKIYIPTR